MNEKLKKIFGVFGVIGGFIVALFPHKRANNTVDKRMEHTKDCIDSSRRTVDEIRSGNSDLEGTVADVKRTCDDLEKSVADIGSATECAEQSVGNAHEAVKRGLDVIAEVEKRNNH